MLHTIGKSKKTVTVTFMFLFMCTADICATAIRQEAEKSCKSESCQGFYWSLVCQRKLLLQFAGVFMQAYTAIKVVTKHRPPQKCIHTVYI